jgi:hypothetical protein
VPGWKFLPENHDVGRARRKAPEPKTGGDGKMKKHYMKPEISPQGRLETQTSEISQSAPF